MRSVEPLSSENPPYVPTVLPTIGLCPYGIAYRRAMSQLYTAAALGASRYRGRIPRANQEQQRTFDSRLGSRGWGVGTGRRFMLHVPFQEEFVFHVSD